MSLITRCPACTTMFKLVPDQLRISAGWVRCGQCGVVFDASVQMLSYADAAAVEAEATQKQLSAAASRVSMPPLPVVARSAPATGTEGAAGVVSRASPPTQPNAAGGSQASSAPAPVVATSAAPFAPSLPKELTPVEAPMSATEEVKAPVQATAPASVTADEIARWRAERAVTGSQGGDALAGDDPAEIHEVDLYLSHLEDHEGDSTELGDGAGDVAPSAPDLLEAVDRDWVDASFVRQARRRKFWQSKQVRVALWASLLLLLVVLALQLVLSRREWLAAAYPGTEPTLQLLCRLTGCQVGPYRYLDGLVVESSSFTRVTGNVYQLNVTLRNKASLRVGTPSFELTLTDAQDQPVLRRVIAPAELGATISLAANGEFAGTARLSLAELPANTEVIGYRVLAFYP